ncbi:MAG: winged helix-turn-helix transcriptional regulator [Gaiellaceae bacterium]
MPDRSYNQYCGVARALDLVGERWALLVVRELVLGGKRFTDLRDGLPGIGTNVLATRLRQLEADGIVEKLRLAPPAATTVYVLTESGRRLVPPMLALGRWGAESLGEPSPEQAVRSEWFAVALNAFFDAEAARDLDATVLLDLADGPFRVTVRDGSLRVEHGGTADFDLALATDVVTLIGYLAGDDVPVEALGAEGDDELLGRLPELFPFGLQPVNVR